MANLTELQKSVNASGITVTLKFEWVGEPSVEKLIAKTGGKSLPLCLKEHFIHLNPGTQGYIGLLNLIAGFVDQK